MTVAKSTKRALLIVLLAGTLLVAGSFACAAIDRGPYYCNHCPLATPTPDSVTTNFIQKIKAPLYRIWPIATLSNTRFIVCNLTHCATYGVTFDEIVG